MDYELEKQLINRHPNLFNIPPTSDEVFGIECDNGWYWILDNLFHMIETEIQISTLNYNRINHYNHILASAKNGNMNDLISYFSDESLAMKEALDGNYLENSEEVQFVRLNQIKEKWGSLRIYYDGGNETIKNYVEFAEAMSNSMCEVCGSTKNIQKTSDGWVRTICTECYEPIKSQNGGEN